MNAPSIGVFGIGLPIVSCAICIQSTTNILSLSSFNSGIFDNRLPYLIAEIGLNYDGKKELAKEFNVSERTIQKDFNERLMSFLPIERIGKEYRVKKGYSLDKNLNFENELVINILESISSSMGKKMSQMSKNLFMILGNGYSGTSLLRYLLNSHSKIICEF